LAYVALVGGRLALPALPPCQELVRGKKGGGGAEGIVMEEAI